MLYITWRIWFSSSKTSFTIYLRSIAFLALFITFFLLPLILVETSFAWQCVGSAETNCLQCHAALGGGTAGSYSAGEWLVSNCFNWPEQDFTPSNSAALSVALQVGEPAIGFTLMNTSGVRYTLSSLLATKPVLLVFGAFTWPPYRNSVPALNQLAIKQYDATSTYDQNVHFIHLYIIEPHPMSPDVSPYTGTVWEGSFSTKGQPLTYDERVAAAQDMLPLIEGNQLILIDDLIPGDRNNPLWCTYGTCPNCAYLIGQDGVIDTTQTWFNANNMETAINTLLGSN